MHDCMNLHSPMLQQVELDEYVHVQLYIASYAYLLTTFEIDLA